MAPNSNTTPTPETPDRPTRYVWPTKGRKSEAAELRRHDEKRLIVRNTYDSSRLVKMAPRALRRSLVKARGDKFRPVYHHGIPTQVPHKDIISAMGVHKKGRKQAATWLPKVKTAQACVLFGLSVKLFLANTEKIATDLRHATLKANGLWVEHKRK